MQKASCLIATVCVSFLLLFLAQQAYLGLRSIPSEVDSLAYHLPIAREIQLNGMFSVPQIPQGWGYYPAVSETILAAILSVDESLANLFNVLGIICVFGIATVLGNAYGLSFPVSLVYGSAISLLPPAMRLVNNQTADLWFQFFTLTSLCLLRLSLGNPRWSLLSGFSLGLLSGTKYSGPFVAAILLLIYPGLRRLLPLRFILSSGLVLAVVGGSWYLRNFLITGNPFYPANIAFLGVRLVGDPTNSLASWTPLKTLLYYPGGVKLFLTSLIWEYNVWLVFLLFFFLHFFFPGRDRPEPETKRLFLSGSLVCLLFLFTPSLPKNLLSDLRYTLPGVSLLILSFFLSFRTSWPELPIYAGLVSILFNAPYLTHHPKVNLVISSLLLLWLTVVGRQQSPSLHSRE